MPALCILTCEGFYPEVARAVAEEGWTDVTVGSLPAYCGRPPWRWEQIAERLAGQAWEQVLLLGVACLGTPPTMPEGAPPVAMERPTQCFHLLAPPALVDEMLEAGAYLMTPAWLRNWRQRVTELGFPGPSAAGYFQEFARKLVLLDTGVEGDLHEELEEIAAALRLPAERIPVGVEPLRQRLRGLVSEWRLGAARQAMQRCEQECRTVQAESLAVTDLLMRLTQAQQEEQVVAQIEEIFRMLFAPESFRLYLCQENTLESVPEASAECRQLAAGKAQYAWTASGKGFLAALRRGDQTLAVAEVERLSFPEYKERYLGLALSIASVAALAIEESRNRARLIEAEKMASLGSLVAGVAHEINTPAGVCLAAASTLEGKSRRLSELFTSRRMKQSDLNGYLESAVDATGLLVSNLNRIGRLIDSFRQVAVERAPVAQSEVVFRELIEEVVGRLGRGWLGESLRVEIECAPEVRVVTSAGDWNSILGNLYSNSLRHAFKERVQGRIGIRASVRDGKLWVEYSDDGSGLSESVRQHIFDPFFTTDMQHGMGLGMHLVYNLIRHRLGGRIDCDARPVGVCFHMQVPLRKESEDDVR